jgi:DoxX-like family
MKKDKIIYWATTGIIAFMMTFSAYSYFAVPDVMVKFKESGFPDYFRVELGVAKFLGAVALILPIVPRSLKFAAYVGFAIVFISAAITHVAIGDTVGSVFPLIFLGILAVSYLYYNKLNTPLVA